MASDTNKESFLTRIANASSLMEAKSIAAQARNNIFMYRVGLSQSIGDVKTAVALNKYIETMCSIFTLIVSGINPIAKNNTEIREVIKSISAENVDPRRISIEQTEIVKAVEHLSIDYDMAAARDPAIPRIGKYARSVEAGRTPEEQKKDDEEEIELEKEKTWEDQYKADHPLLIQKRAKEETEKNETRVKNFDIDPGFTSKLDKLQAFPTILKITFNVMNSGTITIPIAIKANPIGIGQEETRLFLDSALAGRSYKFMRWAKWKSGEISTLEYILGTDIAERDKKLYKSLGRNPIYMEFMKRKANSKFFGSLKAIFTSEQNTLGPTGSLIVTTDDLVQATKLDASRFTKNNEFIQRIMASTFIMCFGIVDVPMEMASFYFMGYKEPFRLNFHELGVGSHVDSNKQLEQALLELSRKVA
jgi:hypothetical protein